MALRKILKYETRQLLRDKKTIFFVFILPLIIFPVVNGFLSKAVSSRLENIVEEKWEVIARSDSFIVNTLGNLSSDSTLSVTYSDNISNKDSLLTIYPAVITSEFDDSLKINTLVISYSGKNDKASIKSNSLYGKLDKLRIQIREKRYHTIGIENYENSSTPEIINISTPQEKANAENSTMLPVSVILILMLGTFMISNYIILGEKDNNTLESLLSSGVKREDIIYGKMSMVIIAGIIMSVLELLSFFIYGKFTGIMNLSVSFDLRQLAIFISIIISVSVLISSVSVFISCKMKSSTTGQLMFLPLMITYLVLGLAGTFEGVEMIKGMLILPVISSAGMIKAVINNRFDLTGGVIVILVNLVYSGFVIRASSGYLNSEEVLSKNSDRDSNAAGVSEGTVYILFALLVVAYMMIGGYMQSANILSGLIYSQVLILGGFAALTVKLQNKTVVEIFRIRSFSLKYLFIAMILGFTARYPIAIISENLLSVFPVPKMISETDILSTDLGNLSLVNLIMISSLLPAVFEELVFRGTFTSMISEKKSGIRTAILTGLMFGAMHLNVFTFFETSCLGIIIGLITIASGSIFPAVIIHFINNASSVSLMKMIENGILKTDHWLLTDNYFAYSVSVIAVLITAYLVHKIMGFQFKEKK